MTKGEGEQAVRKRRPEDPELAAIKRIRGVLEELTGDQGRRVVTNISDWWSSKPTLYRSPAWPVTKMPEPKAVGEGAGFEREPR